MSYEIHGSKAKGGGSSSHTPTEAPNTLQSTSVARVIDVVSDGEIEGLADPANIQKCVYFDDVPLQQDGGTFNFADVTVVQRVGTLTQDSVSGFAESEAEVTLNLPLKQANPVIFAITDEEVNAIRVKVKIESLTQQQSNGDLVGSTIHFKIETQNSGGSYVLKVDKTITGKTVSAYEHESRIELTGAFPINVKITRITADSTVATLRNDTSVSGYTKVVEVNLTYPNTAYIALTVNATSFGGRVPNRSYLIKGIKIKVPTGYDPVARTYPDFWDGTFEVHWSNNPAWVLFDVLTNKRYGLGDFISEDQVDKYGLYTIAKYCDELVSDGNGGTEPRFSANGVINDRREAFTVVNAIASVFRGMGFWSAGGITFSQDAPKDVSRVVSPANVVGGEFSYSGTALKARHTAAMVSYNNPLDNYKLGYEIVEDTELISRLGWRPLEVAAFLCTSQSQARRMGKWLLDSEKNETETITFTGGFEFASSVPGDIIAVSDPNRQGARRGGRVQSYDQVPWIISNATNQAATPTGTAAPLGTFASPTSGAFDRNSLSTFDCWIQIPSGTNPQGVIWEQGSAATSGAYLGFDGNGDLIFRAGDNASSPSATNTCRLVVPGSYFERDRDIRLTWTILSTSSAYIELWVNYQFVGILCTSAGGAMPNSEYADSGDGGYGVSSGNIVAGEVTGYASPFNGVLVSDLFYYSACYISGILSGHYLHSTFFPATTIDVATVNVIRTTSSHCLINFTIATGTNPTGVLFEMGNSTTGVYVGFDGNHDLIVRVGDGGAAPDPLTTVRLVIPGSAFRRDIPNGLTVEWNLTKGRVRVLLNFEFLVEGSTSNGAAWTVSAASAAGGYGTFSDGIVAGESGSYSSNYNGRLGPLYFWNGTTLAEKLGLTDTGQPLASVTVDQSPGFLDGDTFLVVTEDDQIEQQALRYVDGNLIALQKPVRGGIRNGAMWIVQGASLEPELWRIISIRESDPHQYEVTALQYDSTKFDRIELGLKVNPPVTSLFPTGPVVAPTNLVVKESLYKANSVTMTRIDIGWTASKDPRVTLYRVETKEPDNSNWETLVVTPGISATVTGAKNGQWSFRVTALKVVTTAASQSSFISLDYTVVGKTAPPADVTGLVAVRSYTTIELRWTAVTDIDLVGYEIRQGSSWDAGTLVSKQIGTQAVVPLSSSAATTFFIKAYDELNLYSVNAAVVNTSLTPISAVSGLYAYELGSDVDLHWTASPGPSAINYEVRYGPTTATWESATFLTRVASPNWRGPITVSSQTTFRFRVKPFIQLSSSESRLYGSEQTVDITKHVIEGHNFVYTQNEHTTWLGEMARDPYTLVSDVITNITPSETIASGSAITSTSSYTAGQSPPQVGRDHNATFSIDLTVSSSGTPTGCVFEIGSSSTGCYLGFNGSGDLIWRAGNGGAPGSAPNGMARMVVSAANVPKDKQIRILCDIRCTSGKSGRVRLWIDGHKMGEDATDDGSSFTSNVFATTSAGGVNGFQGSVVSGETGSYAGALNANVTLNSGLRYWYNTLVDESLEVTVSNELALVAGATFGAYRFKFDAGASHFGRLFIEHAPLFLSNADLLIDDAASIEVDKADFPITQSYVGVPSIQFFAEFSPDVLLPPGGRDFSFSSVTIRVELRREANDATRPALTSLTTTLHQPSEMN